MAAINGVAFSFSADPSEEPRGNSARAIKVIFTTSGTGTDRLTLQLQDVGIFGGVQTVYYDASLITSTVNFLIRPTLQNIPLPKNSAGYFRALFPPTVLVIDVSSSGSVTLPVILIGGFVEPMIWNGL